MNKLIKEAKRRYPVGTKYHCINKLGKIGSIGVIKGHDFKFWINNYYPGKEDAMYESGSVGLIYVFGKWAPIVGEKENYEIY